MSIHKILIFYFFVLPGLCLGQSNDITINYKAFGSPFIASPPQARGPHGDFHLSPKMTHYHAPKGYEDGLPYPTVIDLNSIFIDNFSSSAEVEYLDPIITELEIRLSSKMNSEEITASLEGAKLLKTAFHKSGYLDTLVMTVAPNYLGRGRYESITVQRLSGTRTVNTDQILVSDPRVLLKLENLEVARKRYKDKDSLMLVITSTVLGRQQKDTFRKTLYREYPNTKVEVLKDVVRLTQLQNKNQDRIEESVWLGDQEVIVSHYGRFTLKGIGGMNGGDWLLKGSTEDSGGIVVSLTEISNKGEVGVCSAGDERCQGLRHGSDSDRKIIIPLRLRARVDPSIIRPPAAGSTLRGIISLSIDAIIEQ